MESTIECREVFLRLGDEEVLIIDVRREDEWCCQDVQIPGALRIPLAELVEAASALPDDELIVLCGCGLEAEVRRAYRHLWIRGLDVVVLQGGMRAWITLGYPTERRRARGEQWLEDGQGQGQANHR